jgi:hypothetical protein
MSLPALARAFREYRRLHALFVLSARAFGIVLILLMGLFPFAFLLPPKVRDAWYPAAEWFFCVVLVVPFLVMLGSLALLLVAEPALRVWRWWAFRGKLMR